MSMFKVYFMHHFCISQKVYNLLAACFAECFKWKYTVGQLFHVSLSGTIRTLRKLY